MIYFPQLSSGAISQFPLRRESGYRTLVNRSFDGREIRLQDLDYFERQWELPLELLTDGEWQAIQDLFATTQGRYKSFLFLEPGESLLAWSENYAEAVWVKAGVAVTPGIDDPFGATAASRLSGAGTLSQVLAIPAKLRYAASIWGRTTEAGAALELADGAGQTASAAFATDGSWRRYTLGTAWTASAAETVAFGVSAPGGGAVDIYGAQLEAQPTASAYKKTLDQGGVHAGARFATDTLADQATEPGRHASVIRISWTPSQT